MMRNCFIRPALGWVHTAAGACRILAHRPADDSGRFGPAFAPSPASFSARPNVIGFHNSVGTGGGDIGHWPFHGSLGRIPPRGCSLSPYERPCVVRRGARWLSPGGLTPFDSPQCLGSCGSGCGWHYTDGRCHSAGAENSGPGQAACGAITDADVGMSMPWYV